MHDSDYSIGDWAKVASPENVTTSATQLAAADTATFATGIQIPAIVCPANRAEMQGMHAHCKPVEMPVYPISRRTELGLRIAGPGVGRLYEIVDPRRFDSLTGNIA